MLIRSKARWIGEKPSKYFCHLEKRTFINKTMTLLKRDCGKEITNQKDILKLNALIRNYIPAMMVL